MAEFYANLNNSLFGIVILVSHYDNDMTVVAEEDENGDVRAVCNMEMGQTKVEMISGSE